MIINEISSTLVQRYGENRINAILNRNISYLTHHIKKICEFVYDEGIDISKVQRAFQQYEQLKKQGEAFDYRNLSFSEFVNKLQTLTISVQLPNVIFTSNDKMIQIGRFDTFEEANSFQKQTNITCCFCTNKVWWNTYKEHGAELYIIHNLYQSSKSRLRYVIVVVLANKKAYFFDMNDKSLRKERGIEVYSKYIASLNGAERYLLENKNINCNRNMNKKLIRLTESDLHRIVKEAVNNIIKLPEMPNFKCIDFDTFKQAVLDSQGLNRAEKGQLISFYYEYEGLLEVFFTEDDIDQIGTTFSDFMDAVEDYDGYYNEYGEYETERVKLPVGWSWKSLYSVTEHIINDIKGNNVNFEDYEDTLF